MSHSMFRRLGCLVLALTLVLGSSAYASEGSEPYVQELTVEEVRELLRTRYVDPVDEEILALPTVEEILDALGDPYTAYMSPQQVNDFTGALEDQEVVGVGVRVEYRADGLHVLYVLPGGPAEKAGLQIHDLIVTVDGHTLEEMGSSQNLGGLIAGEAGSSVTLTALRGDEALTFTMERAQVSFPMVDGSVEKGHIGLITATDFGLDAPDYLADYVDRYDKQVDRWVMDIRDNGGGYDVSVEGILGHFLGTALISRLQYHDSTNNWITWFGETIVPEDEPVIVLTNANSASASEVFALAMKEMGRALLIGEQTYGKGVGQHLFTDAQGYTLKMTTFRYYSPRWVTPDKSGVLPHLVLGNVSLADEVAVLLSGDAVKQGTKDVLRAEIAGWEWFVHKEDALAEPEAMAELLGAITPQMTLTLDGKTVTPTQVAEAWGIEFRSFYFHDLEDSPYADEINALAAMGLVRGAGDGGFNPDGSLTRAEMAAFLTQCLGLWCWETDEMPYTDVAEGDWYAGPAVILHELGIMEGDGAGRFNPNDTLDYQQFLTILLRAGAMVDSSLEELLENAGPTGYYKKYPNLIRFASWAQTAASVALDGDLLSWAEDDGTAGYVNPYGLLPYSFDQVEPDAVPTREEVAVVLYNMMRYSGILYGTADISTEQ